jgi:hypothetical protein
MAILRPRPSQRRALIRGVRLHAHRGSRASRSPFTRVRGLWQVRRCRWRTYRSVIASGRRTVRLSSSGASTLGRDAGRRREPANLPSRRSVDDFLGTEIGHPLRAGGRVSFVRYVLLRRVRHRPGQGGSHDESVRPRRSGGRQSSEAIRVGHPRQPDRIGSPGTSWTGPQSRPAPARSRRLGVDRTCARGTPHPLVDADVKVRSVGVDESCATAGEPPNVDARRTIRRLPVDRPP